MKTRRHALAAARTLQITRAVSALSRNLGANRWKEEVPEVAHAPSKARSAASEVGQENVAFITILVPKAMGTLLRAASTLSTNHGANRWKTRRCRRRGS